MTQALLCHRALGIKPQASVVLASFGSLGRSAATAAELSGEACVKAHVVRARLCELVNVGLVERRRLSGRSSVFSVSLAFMPKATKSRSRTSPPFLGVGGVPAEGGRS